MNFGIIKTWIFVVIVVLGLMHHSRTRKIFHIIFILCLYSLIVLLGFKEYAIFIIVLYSVILMIWTLYERRLLVRTHLNLSYILNTDAIILKPWTPKWKEEFLNEKVRLNEIILLKWKHIFHKELSSDGLVHIGSTSIENIGFAKPMHDVAIAITTKDLPKNFCEDLEKAGYKYMGAAPHTLSCQDHWFFNITPINEVDSKGYGFDLHVVLPPVHQWLRESLHFSQYLTENQIDRERYSNLKSEIIETTKEHHKYSMKKQTLIPILLERSRQWAKNK